MEDFDYEFIGLTRKEIKYIKKILLDKESYLFHILRKTKNKDLAFDVLSKQYMLCKQCRLKLEE